MKNFAVAMLSCFLLCSCEPDEETIQKAKTYNATSLASPVIIGTNHNGFVIERYPIKCEYETSVHWVYIAYRDGDGQQTISVNKQETQGKTTINRVEVMVNGNKAWAVESKQ